MNRMLFFPLLLSFLANCITAKASPESFYSDDKTTTKQGLSFGAYGEVLLINAKNDNLTFDPKRFVLLPSYRINEWMIFNAELELEHAAVVNSDIGSASNTNTGRFDGELELEQIYISFLISPAFNIRSPGIHLIPVGYINLHHEPTLFYSADRPKLYRELIPSTWFEPGIFAFFGELGNGFRYDFLVTMGLEDLNSAKGIDGSNGLRNARPRLRRSNNESFAYSFRLAWDTPSIAGLGMSFSTYYAPRVNNTGANTSGVTLIDYEVRYRSPIGLELRGDVAFAKIKSVGNILANSDTSSSDNVGDSLAGWYLEAAYHFSPESWRKGEHPMELVPFVRVTKVDLQKGDLPVGSSITNNKTYLTAGVAWYPSSSVVLKVDHESVSNGDHTESLAMGFFF